MSSEITATDISSEDKATSKEAEVRGLSLSGKILGFANKSKKTKPQNTENCSKRNSSADASNISFQNAATSKVGQSSGLTISGKLTSFFKKSKDEEPKNMELSLKFSKTNSETASPDISSEDKVASKTVEVKSLSLPGKLLGFANKSKDEDPQNMELSLNLSKTNSETASPDISSEDKLTSKMVEVKGLSLPGKLLGFAHKSKKKQPHSMDLSDDNRSNGNSTSDISS